VIEREGDAVRYHPSLLALADHYGYEPLACRPYRPNEKGSVERRVRDLRSSFLAATAFGTLPEFRTAFDTWRNTVLGQRIADPATRQTVAERAAHERTLMRPLPQNVFGEWPVKSVVVGKQPWVTVDTNRYSVPHTLVGRALSLLVTHERICVLDGAILLADHVRTWDKHTQVDDPEHAAALRAAKKRANEQDGRQRLLQACPLAVELLARLVQYGEFTGSHTRRLNTLVEKYGPDKVNEAIGLAIERGTILSSSVQFLLVRGEPPAAVPDGPPPIPVILPDRADVREQHFNTHPLKDYDVCTTAPDHRHR
jgi:hypothetical protein